MRKKDDLLDVCIVGGGFAGLNAALILAENNINCEIFTTGYGASQLWVGTFDFLNYDGTTLQEAFSNFQKDFPAHPYGNLTYSEVKTSFDDFFEKFSEFQSFTKNDQYSNKDVLTLIGNLKPCIGTWGSVFNDFNCLDSETSIILVDFYEFNNSAMELVAKGLRERFQSTFKIMRLSFSRIMEIWNIEVNNEKIDGLSDFRIGNYLDKNLDNLDSLGIYLLEELKIQYPNLDLGKLKYILFPPVLGIRNNEEILEELLNILKIECREIVAFSPSLMSRRFMASFNDKLDKYSMNIHKRFELIDLQRKKLNGDMIWQLIFKDSKGKKKVISSKYSILAMGSVFQTGLFEQKQNFKMKFKELNINIPNKLPTNFELAFLKENFPSNLFVCGAASYCMLENITDDLEIEFGTGLGLAISISYKVSIDIVERLNK